MQVEPPSKVGGLGRAGVAPSWRSAPRGNGRSLTTQYSLVTKDV